MKNIFYERKSTWMKQKKNLIRQTNMHKRSAKNLWLSSCLAATGWLIANLEASKELLTKDG